MCLFSIAYQIIPGCPVLVLANREESPHRPSSAPAFVQGPHPDGCWLGGRDLKAGGTWLGVNRTGLVVAVTNRPQHNRPEQPKSRGLLCRSVLERGSFAAAVAEVHRQWSRELFAGFNLMLISPEEGRVFSAGEDLDEQPLVPGIHSVTNGGWNDPGDPRIARFCRLMERLHRNQASLDDWIHEGQTILGLGEEAGGDALCYSPTGGWGTVSSSILRLTDDPREARYLHAAGPPATTAFEDHSPELISLLTTSRHRIRLKGPWRYEWVTPQEGLPAEGRATLPAAWRDLFGEAAGRVRFQRTFHAPTNLQTASEVNLVFEDLARVQALSLNGRDLSGQMPAGESSFRIAIGELLQPTNDLQVEIAFEPGTSSEPGGLWGTVALEIVEHDLRTG